MKLEQVNYYRIRRNEDDRRETIHDRLFEMALRWEPLTAFDPDGKGVDAEIVTAGKTHLNRLMQGDEVSERHLQMGLDYLIEAILYYDLTTYEPYPGRNKEAAADLRALSTELLRADYGF
jgi:hypothetical protein